MREGRLVKLALAVAARADCRLGVRGLAGGVLAETGPMQVLAGALLALPLAVADEYAPTREYDHRHPGHLHALVEVVIGALVGCRRAHGMGGVGIPDDHIGVAARRDNALLGIDAKELGRVGAGELDP